jgi:Pyridoxamine 5'-phosphate oxidase
VTPEELDAFLSGPHVARVATASAAGMPYATPVWYEWSSGVVSIVLAESRPHLVNLRENPSIAICVDEDPRPAQGLEAWAGGATLIGRPEVGEPVTLSGDDAVMTPVFLRIAAHYLGPEYGVLETQPAGILAACRALVRLRPSRIVSWRAG